MRLSFEQRYPYFLSILLTLTFLWFHDVIDLPSTSQTLFPVIISSGAIAVGFLMTAKSILISIDQRRVIRQLKQTGRYTYLIQYLIAAVKWSFLTIIYTTVGMLAEFHRFDPWATYLYTAGWVFVTTTAVGCAYRVIDIFSVILKRIAEEGEQLAGVAKPTTE